MTTGHKQRETRTVHTRVQGTQVSVSLSRAGLTRHRCDSWERRKKAGKHEQEENYRRHKGRQDYQNEIGNTK